MRDKLIRIKRSRLKPEELFLIDLFNMLTIEEKNVNILYTKDKNIYFVYSHKDKSIRFSRELVFEPLSNILVDKGFNVISFVKSFCRDNFGMDINLGYVGVD